MFNEMIVVSVTPFSGTSSTDKNGESPVMLQCIAGRMPNRNVLSGTVAKRAGIEVGKTYLMQCREQGYDAQFGTDFNFVKVKELTEGADIAITCKQLGTPEIVNIPRPDGYEETYERKSDAIEGLRTKRIKEGKYKPAIPTSVTNHSTAKEITEGVSTENDTRFQGNEDEATHGGIREKEEVTKENAETASPDTTKS